MANRIHIVVDEEEKAQFRRKAKREGKSLSAWLRDAAREKVMREQTGRRLETAEDLAAFFVECDRRESGREPDWEEHRRVIERSMGSGATDT